MTTVQRVLKAGPSVHKCKKQNMIFKSTQLFLVIYWLVFAFIHSLYSFGWERIQMDHQQCLAKEKRFCCLSGLNQIKMFLVRQLKRHLTANCHSCWRCYQLIKHCQFKHIQTKFMLPFFIGRDLKYTKILTTSQRWQLVRTSEFMKIQSNLP